MLHIYNSLTREKAPFTPLQPGKVGIYVCGMTVYDYCHMGHARVLVCFDVITRYLRASGFDVNYVRNITDIDDKIIHRANELDQDFRELTQKFIDAMHEDEAALGVLSPDVEPRATQHMAHIIAMIEQLLANGYAYRAENGDIYFDTPRFNDYGKLSRKDLDGQQAGIRVDVVDVKKHPLDFVLWKQAKPSEPSWESPWGEGRPGWHIECSAMSTECLGAQFDIHGGGFDLQFPHHENEIAQSEAANQQPFANNWLHVGYLQINSEKMSKSLGNFFTIREVLAKYPHEAVRYFLLSSHYRSQLNYSDDSIAAAEGALNRFYTVLRDVPVAASVSESEFTARFNEAMNDDFNTPKALAVLFELAHHINQIKAEQAEKAAQFATELKSLAGVLGILQADPNSYLRGDFSEQQLADIEQLVSAREAARAEKNFAKADELRDQLHQLSIELEDTASGTLWRRKR